MMNAKYVSLEEELDTLLAQTPLLRAIKAIPDKKRPRLVSDVTIATGPSLKADYAKVEELFKHDEACVVIVRVEDQECTVPKVEAGDSMVIMWIPEGTQGQTERMVGGAYEAVVQSLPDARVKPITARKKDDLTLAVFLNKTSVLQEVVIDRIGSCLCGEIQFQAAGPVKWNALNHGKDCAAATGVSPVHYIALPSKSVTILKGAGLVQTLKTFAFCGNCGTVVYQEMPAEISPDTRAVFPANFHIVGEDGVSCKLPKELLPAAHYNYDSRQFDWNDKLPKFKDMEAAGKAVVSEFTPKPQPAQAPETKQLAPWQRERQSRGLKKRSLKERGMPVPEKPETRALSPWQRERQAMASKKKALSADMSGEVAARQRSPSWQRNKEKEEARRKMQEEVVAWIETELQESKGSQNLTDWLSNGKILCTMANRVRPGVVKKIRNAKALHQDNIYDFCQACRKIGVKDIPAVEDVMKGRDTPKLMRCLKELIEMIKASSSTAELQSKTDATVDGTTKMETKKELGAGDT